MTDYIKMVNGVEVPMTPEEIEARQAEENAPPVLSLPEQLDQLFTQLPAEARAQFFTLKAAVKLALEQKDIEAAVLIIENATVPDELADAKAQMLAVFND